MILGGYNRTTNHAITITVDNGSACLVSPNFIYNRFDLYSNIDASEFETLHVSDGKKDYYVQVLYRRHPFGTTAHLGIWLTEIPGYVVSECGKYILGRHKNVEYVSYTRSYSGEGFSCPINHFRIKIPKTSEEMYSRLSAKSRYNINRERRLLEQETGGLIFEEYDSVSEGECFYEAVDAFLRMKEKTHKGRVSKEWHSIKARDYAERSQTSHVYVMRGERERNIIAVVLSCEQCPVVYIENLSYDMKYSKYSAGKMIYHYYLGRLADKGKSELFLSGGDLAYKRRYGSIEENLYSGSIYRYGYFSHCYYAFKRKLINAAKICLKVLVSDKQLKALKAVLIGKPSRI
ncbi:MAG: GNAT family N-acetyltransferase [Synergistaceae bacterium]|nr:GNAT family N-acetyltransferase [Synergistaceae bacterium]